MSEPTATAAGGLGLTLFGVATGIDPVLLAAGAAGGYAAMAYMPEMPVPKRLASIGISALFGAWGAPAVLGEAVARGLVSAGYAYPTICISSLLIGTLSLTVIVPGLVRLGRSKIEEATQ
jgi:hypothetical protein